MIGAKKMSTIRKEIEESLGDDPIKELERQIAAAKRSDDRTEVMEGLKRFLETSPKRTHRKRRVAAKK